MLWSIITDQIFSFLAFWMFRAIAPTTFLPRTPDYFGVPTNEYADADRLQSLVQGNDPDQLNKLFGGNYLHWQSCFEFLRERLPLFIIVDLHQ
ncbi:hypothetical protein DO97_00705 [Neosynechococcus sphagnicola sy1]|uniref:Uncharacterized protein n=1 Tax=Neosynechococcus sphagnicola sy1 TaxID=1497020 RepID=A0A098TP68_9CYAN|nr:hypothetical protein DO97_00705 [Neosynechococcus sphagnicola sy1]